MIIMVATVTIFPWLAWAYPEMLFDPTGSFITRRLKPYETKLMFFTFFGAGSITGAIPWAISMLCLEIRLFLTSSTACRLG